MSISKWIDRTWRIPEDDMAFVFFLESTTSRIPNAYYIEVMLSLHCRLQTLLFLLSHFSLSSFTEMRSEFIRKTCSTVNVLFWKTRDITETDFPEWICGWEEFFQAMKMKWKSRRGRGEIRFEGVGWDGVFYVLSCRRDFVQKNQKFWGWWRSPLSMSVCPEFDVLFSFLWVFLLLVLSFPPKCNPSWYEKLTWWTWKAWIFRRGSSLCHLLPFFLSVSIHSLFLRLSSHLFYRGWWKSFLLWLRVFHLLLFPP